MKNDAIIFLLERNNEGSDYNIHLHHGLAQERGAILIIQLRLIFHFINF